MLKRAEHTTHCFIVRQRDAAIKPSPLGELTQCVGQQWKRVSAGCVLQNSINHFRLEAKTCALGGFCDHFSQSARAKRLDDYRIVDRLGQASPPGIRAQKF